MKQISKMLLNFHCIFSEKVVSYLKYKFSSYIPKIRFGVSTINLKLISMGGRNLENQVILSLIEKSVVLVSLEFFVLKRWTLFVTRGNLSCKDTP